MIKYFGITIIICLWSLSINAQSFCQTPALRQLEKPRVFNRTSTIYNETFTAVIELMNNI